MRPRGIEKVAVAVALALTLAACSSVDPGGGSAKSQDASVTTLDTLPSLPPETTTSGSSTTTEAPTSTTAAPAQPSPGASIPGVRALQERPGRAR